MTEGRLQPRSLVAKSLPVSIQRGASPAATSYQSDLSEVANPYYLHGASYSESEDEYELVQRGEEAQSLIPAITRRQRSYGAVPDVQPVHKRRRKIKKRSGYRHSTTVASVADFGELFGSYKRLENVTEQTQDEEEEEESEDEEPPIIEMIYRRNCKDKTKLIVLPVLYFTFMVLAGVFSFYSISALIESYSYQVRSVRDVHVTSYTPVGIAMFLEDYGTFHDCSFKYNDNLAPPKGNFTPLLPGEVCDHKNITFWSKLVNANRTAMVFKGPSELKVSIALNFSVNTSRRNFGALEFMLLENWHSLNSPDVAGILARTEVKSPLYTVPAGFRTWIKMTYTVYSKVKGSGNSSEFTLSFGFSTYNDWNKILNQPTNVIYVLFEWKDDTYEYVTEILSTNLWNTLGSLAGIFVGLYKAGELCTAWIKRVRRERRKKLIKLSELEEQQKRLMEEYEERKREKEERKQTLRKEDFPRLSPLKESQRLSPMKAEPQRVTVTPHRDIPRRQQEEV